MNTLALIIVWAFIAYGMTSIIVWGAIFDKPRNWVKRNIKFLGDLVSCTLCTSTWVGFFLSIVLGGLTKNFFPTNSQFLDIFFDGMFTAGMIWAINSIVEYFEEKR